MFLAVDIGNSQTSFGFFNPALQHHWRSQTNRARTADEYAAFLFPLFQRVGIQISDLTGIALCSVVPAADFAFEQFCRTYLKKTLFKIDYRVKLGFKLSVDFPEEVGADRLANAAFASERLSLPAIVVDLGTATTFDVVTQDRAYGGGVILPGPQLAMESLGLKTSKLPMVNLEFPDRVIGKNTIECIQAGILFGYCDLIDGLLARTIFELGNSAEVVLTGGFASYFQGKLKTNVQYFADLTLEGIEILYRRNSEKA